MSRRDAHLADDELLALSYTGADADVRDTAALAHAAVCIACGRRLADLSATVADLRLAAEADADQHFSESLLERQRRQILMRIEHLGQRARILRFPAATAAPAADLASRPPIRRWLAGAVAAGLVGGFLLAESLHLLPGDAGWAFAQRSAAGQDAGIGLAEMATLEDDDFLFELDAALGQSRSSELRALDALTPVSYEIR